MVEIRVRSPRCPSISLEEALNRVAPLYDKEGKHFVAVDAVAQGLGYKDGNNGAAKTMLASITYYGLLKRSSDGKIAVSPDYERYKFAPEQELKNEFLNTWIRSPKVFAELLEKYGNDLPSDAALKYELIGMGFKPDAADDAANVFRASLNYVKSNGSLLNRDMDEAGQEPVISQVPALSAIADRPAAGPNPIQKVKSATPPAGFADNSDMRPIHIFLQKGREAILYVPRPLFAADIERIKKQIDILPTDDEDEEW